MVNKRHIDSPSPHVAYILQVGADNSNELQIGLNAK